MAALYRFNCIIAQRWESFVSIMESSEWLSLTAFLEQRKEYYGEKLSFNQQVLPVTAKLTGPPILADKTHIREVNFLDIIT